MKKLAVTGSLASGKTTVCELLKAYGAYVVNADAIAHRLLSSDHSVGQKVVALLGQEIFDGHQFDRKKIAEKVFSNPEKLKALETILHPIIHDEIEKEYNRIKDQKKYAFFVAEIPLLYETEGHTFYDMVISVLADERESQKRFEQSTGHTMKEYERRMARQLSAQEKATKADYIILNNGTLEELKDNVKALIPLLIAVHPK